MVRFPVGLPENKIRPYGSILFSGDLGGNRTRVAGMKTRCTNRYTTRPYAVIISKLTKNCKSKCIRLYNLPSQTAL